MFGKRPLGIALCVNFKDNVRVLSNNASVHLAKNGPLHKQAKILSKLFGDRVAGSKKRWYPTHEGTSQTSQAALFQASQFGKPISSSGGKNTTRRTTVLNKLFMKHISDYLATGEASEAILGRGLQIHRVKISSDFANMNVYWLGSGNPTDDAVLETELQRCSGVLRHELSQLALMGVVPRIKFVRDRKNANLGEVEAILRNIDFGADEETADGDEMYAPKSKRTSAYDNMTAHIMENDFYGRPMPLPQQVDEETPPNNLCGEHLELPEMRHDVLGLDHNFILTKILAKMRKSKQAWDLHSQHQVSNQITVLADENKDATTTTTVGKELESVRRKLEQAAQDAAKFDKFLAKRRERKNTPERKKYRKPEELFKLDSGDGEDYDIALSANQRRILHEEDYLPEEYESDRNI